MKTKFVAAGKREFSWHFMWLFGMGYSKDYFHYDSHSCQEFVSWYLPFLRVSATQYFRKFKKETK